MSRRGHESPTRELTASEPTDSERSNPAIYCKLDREPNQIIFVLSSSSSCRCVMTDICTCLSAVNSPTVVQVVSIGELVDLNRDGTVITDDVLDVDSELHCPRTDL